MEDSYKTAKEIYKEFPNIRPSALQTARKELDELREKVASLTLSNEQLLELGEGLARLMESDPKLANELIEKLQTIINKMGYTDIKLPTAPIPQEKKAQKQVSPKKKKENKRPAGKSKLLKRI